MRRETVMNRKTRLEALINKFEDLYNRGALDTSCLLKIMLHWMEIVSCNSYNRFRSLELDR
jgi:hypothetical protein